MSSDVAGCHRGLTRSGTAPHKTRLDQGATPIRQQSASAAQRLSGRLYVRTRVPFASDCAYSFPPPPRAATAQLGERQTEDLKVPGLIPGLGVLHLLVLCASNLNIPLAVRGFSRFRAACILTGLATTGCDASRLALSHGPAQGGRWGAA
jgi:hypothetical protein